MKTLQHTILIGLLTVLCLMAEAQKEDYVWLSGYNSQDGFDSTQGIRYGISRLDFNYDPVLKEYDSIGMSFSRTNTSMCDSDGNLLFYTNGIFIANAFNEKIANSDSLNAGWFQYSLYPEIQQGGYRNSQGVVAIPVVEHPNLYYIFHSYVDSVGAASIVRGTKILLTTLDLKANNGHGQVLAKNVPIIEDIVGLEVSACRHGNGRDWWILVQKRNSNCYYRILIDQTGVHVMPNLTCCGLSTSGIHAGAANFSCDGNKYAYFNTAFELSICDFDRCSGLLSNPVTWTTPNPGLYAIGAAFSPSSNFLYVCMTSRVIQFDLNAPDIIGGIDTVASYDGATLPFPAYFHTAQNAPDGKIYISCGNADTVWHVIEEPDSKGDSCQFNPHGLNLFSPSSSVPNYPNYRLGPLLGSPCDTLGLGIAQSEKERQLTIYPNPASDYITIDYGNTNWAKGNVELEVLNALGQIVYAQTLPSYSSFQKVDVSYLPQGYYVVQLKRNAAVVAGRPFVKE